MFAPTAPARLGIALTSVEYALHTAFPRGTPTVTRLADRLAPQYRPWQLGAALFTTFGVLALIVAAVGIYSSVSYTVTQRTHEIGVRIAIGARATDILQHVIGTGVRPVLLGAAMGILLAGASGRFISSLLYGIAPWNPALMGGVASLLVITGIGAASVPAWRAMKVDPVRVLAGD